MDNDPNTPTSTGLAPNVSCLLSWLFGIIFFFVEKKHQPSRWWAKQSIVVFAIAIVWNILVQILVRIPGIGVLIALLAIPVSLIFLVIGILGIIKSWTQPDYEMPVIGALARKYLPAD